MGQTSLIAHQNHKLFSDYYLDQILPKENALWGEVPRIEEVFRKIKELYLKYNKDFLVLSEAQLEREFIQPVLEILGHDFEVQPTLPTSEGTKKPDYAFFDSDKMKTTARRKFAGGKRFFENALAIGDAKKWDRDLDRKAEKGKDVFSNLNPSYQIDYYLRASDRSWGILTNGRQWRLYHRETSYSLDSFYQVNLEELLARKDFDAFRYFYLFFRLEAFLPLVDRQSFLDLVRKDSRSFTAAVEEDLKGRAYSTLEKIMQGFLAYRPNRLKAEENKEEIKENSLILLYRLLFIHFAESNRLLPIDNISYAQKYSLGHLADRVLDELSRAIELDDDSTEYWDYLQRLFKWIDAGHDEPSIPEYNGGLFDPKVHPFLKEKKFGDRHLAEILKALTISKQNGSEVRVVYRDLGIQHLGSVYEGLLEFRPVVKVGTIVLESDKGERKATGSYYTPDYIVRYIVENTLKPLTDQAKSHMDILDLMVLDPAMGSGHFLVGAVDFLAEQIVYHPNTELVAKGVEEKEIQYWRRKVVESCIYGVDLNPMAVELAKLSLWIHTVAYGKPLSFLDHHLRCGNSLIGAKLEDLGALPVVGKKAKAVRPPVLSEEFLRKDIGKFSQFFAHIQRISSERKGDMEQKERLFEEFSVQKEKYKKLADFWISIFFGNSLENKKDQVKKLGGDDLAVQTGMLGVSSRKITKNTKESYPVTNTVYRALQRAIQHGQETELKKLNQLLDNSERLAGRYRFFHWELEFPEAYFDEQGRPKKYLGFDAVIGNPPYGRYQMISDEEKVFIRTLGLSFGSGDLAEAFVSRALRLSKNGIVGFIIPKVVTYVANWSTIREELLKYEIARIADVSKAFEGVLYEQVVFCTGNKKVSTVYVDVAESNQITEKNRIRTSKLSKAMFPIYSVGKAQKIEENILSRSEPLAKSFQFWYGKGGMVPYLSEEKQETYLEIIQGRDIDRYLELPHKALFLPVRELSDIEITENKRTKLIVQDIVAHITTPGPHVKITAHIDDRGRIPLNTLTCVVPDNSNYSLPFLLAIMNSKLCAWYVHTFIFNLAIRTMHYMPGYIERTQIPTVDFNTNEVLQRSYELMKGQYSVYISSLTDNILLKNVELALRDGLRKDLHDFINFLSKQMTRMTREKQDETESYLGWLAKLISVDIEQLRAKRSMKHFFAYEFDQFYGLLKQARFKSTANLDSRKIQENMKVEFEKSAAVLMPLNQKILKTDWLIDQIVYRMYGLTEEEIAIVEGRKQ